MKTKTYLLVCLLMGIGLTQLSAQKKSIDRSWPWWWEEELVGYFPITCDGVDADWLECYGKSHIVDHVLNYECVWRIFQVNWTATSVVTGEVFHAQEQDKLTLTSWENQEYAGTWRGNLVGNKGSVYQITIAITVSFIPPYTSTWSLIKANCH